MPHLNDAMYTALRTQLYTGAVNDMVVAMLKAQGASGSNLNDLWRSFFIQELGLLTLPSNNLVNQDGGAGGVGDKGDFVLTDLRLAEVATGNLTIATMYEISARSSEDFTADGAPDNNVGTTFVATAQNVTLDANNKAYPIDSSAKPFVTNLVGIDSNVGNGALKTTYVDHASGFRIYFREAGDLTSDLTIAEQYLLRFVGIALGSTVTVRVYDGAGTVVTGFISTELLTTYDIIFTASNVAGCYMMAGSMSEGEKLWIEKYSLYHISAGIYSFNDLAMAYLTSLGFITGSLNDRWLAFWVAGGVV